MQIFYDSMTGNVRRFAAEIQRLSGLPVHDLRRDVPAGEYLLMTYTFGTGGVPETTARFLTQQANGLRGVVSSGSFHWGANFARAGEQIAAQYGVPLVAKINKAGSAADREIVANWIRAQMGTYGRTETQPTRNARSLYGTLD